MTDPLATPPRPRLLDLYFGPWYRRSPFFEKTLEHGASAYRHIQPHVPAWLTTPTPVESTGPCSTT
jgi:hypothetical protein